MEAEVIAVVEPIDQGTRGKKTSLYVLVPKKLSIRLGIQKSTQFLVILAKNGDIIYRKQEA